MDYVEKRPDEPISLHGLDPEEALKALLKVRPDSGEPEQDQADDAPARQEQADREDDPAR